MVDFHIPPFLQGFATSAGLIIAIGAQNAFVLKQALLRNHVFLIAILCSIIDAALILLGVFGFATLLETSPLLLTIAKWGGFIFLGYYGFRSFKNVFHPHALEMDKKKIKPSIKKIVSLTLAFSLLNPHTYLDTVVLLGSVSSQFNDAEQPSFAVGACLASFIWFFSLGYGACFLGPLFKKPQAWKILDFIVGCMMWMIAIAIVL
ncbi:LysE/ArgO family amino acid transporter [Candidatus Odyssella acanthamoebae]|uniref:Amino acid transporter n=1 Tax=Candidatus Odyssella acanthamoebae TaxID=91604 RepID=A0A077B211_9PROT|nr:LysE/ArgO family amino acid transporter [Candidatus Paracaedibacter acanthamoebae]AIK96980.1 amino acid transporter [Candidatus Paracaedibacter acanthamoebae]